MANNFCEMYLQPYAYQCLSPVARAVMEYNDCEDFLDVMHESTMEATREACSEFASIWCDCLGGRVDSQTLAEIADYMVARCLQESFRTQAAACFGQENQTGR